MHILDKVTTGVLSMIVMAACILAFDLRIGLIFVAGILLSFPIYSFMQRKGKELSAKRQKIQSEASPQHWNTCRDFRCKVLQYVRQNLIDIEDAHESNVVPLMG